MKANDVSKVFVRTTAHFGGDWNGGPDCNYYVSRTYIAIDDEPEREAQSRGDVPIIDWFKARGFRVVKETHHAEAFYPDDPKSEAEDDDWSWSGSHERKWWLERGTGWDLL